MIIVITGAPKTGKSFIAKKIARKYENATYLIDFNNEYDFIPENQKFFEAEQLIEFGMNNKNKVLLFEEATSYFSSRNSVRFRALLSRHRHFPHLIILIFHYYASIPSDVIPYCDYFFCLNSYEKNLPEIFDLPKPAIYHRTQLNW